MAAKESITFVQFDEKREELREQVRILSGGGLQVRWDVELVDGQKTVGSPRFGWCSELVGSTEAEHVLVGYAAAVRMADLFCEEYVGREVVVDDTPLTTEEISEVQRATLAATHDDCFVCYEVRNGKLASLTMIEWNYQAGEPAWEESVAYDPLLSEADLDKGPAALLPQTEDDWESWEYLAYGVGRIHDVMEQLIDGGFRHQPDGSAFAEGKHFFVV